jgi:hypothetical protein
MKPVPVALLKSLPGLRENASSDYGKAGAIWFDTLPLTVAEATKRFRLTPLDRVRRGSMSVVIGATTAGAIPVILKIVFTTPAIPCETDLLVRASGRG